VAGRTREYQEERANMNYVPGGPAVSADPAAELRMPIIEM